MGGSSDTGAVNPDGSSTDALFVHILQRTVSDLYDQQIPPVASEIGRRLDVNLRLHLQTERGKTGEKETDTRRDKETGDLLRATFVDVCQRHPNIFHVVEVATGQSWQEKLQEGPTRSPAVIKVDPNGPGKRKEKESSEPTTSIRPPAGGSASRLDLMRTFVFLRNCPRAFEGFLDPKLCTEGQKEFPALFFALLLEFLLSLSGNEATVPGALPSPDPPEKKRGDKKAEERDSGGDPNGAVSPTSPAAPCSTGAASSEVSTRPPTSLNAGRRVRVHCRAEPGREGRGDPPEDRSGGRDSGEPCSEPSSTGDGPQQRVVTPAERARSSLQKSALWDLEDFLSPPSPRSSSSDPLHQPAEGEGGASTPRNIPQGGASTLRFDNVGPHPPAKMGGGDGEGGRKQQQRSREAEGAAGGGSGAPSLTVRNICPASQRGRVPRHAYAFLGPFLRGGRFLLAVDLQENAQSPLRALSLGRLNVLVQAAVEAGLVAYENNCVKPVACCVLPSEATAVAVARAVLALQKQSGGRLAALGDGGGESSAVSCRRKGEEDPGGVARGGDASSPLSASVHPSTGREGRRVRGQEGASVAADGGDEREERVEEEEEEFSPEKKGDGEEQEETDQTIEEQLDLVRKRIVKLVGKHKNGLCLSHVRMFYEEEFKESLQVLHLGFPKLKAFLERGMLGLVEVVPCGPFRNLLRLPSSSSSSSCSGEGGGSPSSSTEEAQLGKERRQRQGVHSVETWEGPPSHPHPHPMQSSSSSFSSASLDPGGLQQQQQQQPAAGKTFNQSGQRLQEIGGGSARSNKTPSPSGAFGGVLENGSAMLTAQQPRDGMTLRPAGENAGPSGGTGVHRETLGGEAAAAKVAWVQGEREKERPLHSPTSLPPPSFLSSVLPRKVASLVRRRRPESFVSFLYWQALSPHPWRTLATEGEGEEGAEGERGGVAAAAHGDCLFSSEDDFPMVCAFLPPSHPHAHEASNFALTAGLRVNSDSALDPGMASWLGVQRQGPGPSESLQQPPQQAALSRAKEGDQGTDVSGLVLPPDSLTGCRRALRRLKRFVPLYVSPFVSSGVYASWGLPGAAAFRDLSRVSLQMSGAERDGQGPQSNLPAPPSSHSLALQQDAHQQQQQQQQYTQQQQRQQMSGDSPQAVAAGFEREQEKPWGSFVGEREEWAHGVAGDACDIPRFSSLMPPQGDHEDPRQDSWQEACVRFLSCPAAAPLPLSSSSEDAGGVCLRMDTGGGADGGSLKEARNRESEGICGIVGGSRPSKVKEGPGNPSPPPPPGFEKTDRQRGKGRGEVVEDTPRPQHSISVGKTKRVVPSPGRALCSTQDASSVSRAGHAITPQSCDTYFPLNHSPSLFPLSSAEADLESGIAKRSSPSLSVPPETTRTGLETTTTTLVSSSATGPSSLLAQTAAAGPGPLLGSLPSFVEHAKNAGAALAQEGSESVAGVWRALRSSEFWTFPFASLQGGGQSDSPTSKAAESKWTRGAATIAAVPWPPLFSSSSFDDEGTAGASSRSRPDSPLEDTDKHNTTTSSRLLLLSSSSHRQTTDAQSTVASLASSHPFSSSSVPPQFPRHHTVATLSVASFPAVVAAAVDCASPEGSSSPCWNGNEGRAASFPTVAGASQGEDKMGFRDDHFPPSLAIPAFVDALTTETEQVRDRPGPLFSAPPRHPPPTKIYPQHQNTMHPHSDPCTRHPPELIPDVLCPLPPTGDLLKEEEEEAGHDTDLFPAPPPFPPPPPPRGNRSGSGRRRRQRDGSSVGATGKSLSSVCSRASLLSSLSNDAIDLTRQSTVCSNAVKCTPTLEPRQPTIQPFSHTVRAHRPSAPLLPAPPPAHERDQLEGPPFPLQPHAPRGALLLPQRTPSSRSFSTAGSESLGVRPPPLDPLNQLGGLAGHPREVFFSSSSPPQTERGMGSGAETGPLMPRPWVHPHEKKGRGNGKFR
uniref:HTH OST-type domain-containing protein n=1 Tax=Chromera velia CCMP2878 TaxID=1169474 RepID=A0A0G4FI71_9ALVE|eukprot:Cvel_17116.t1-p1 / transcript=Cvel_17116.t1 / gene=Cvel_17116 / organism=Chromera_velia_CCMP2878 / gene_product=hypothetical protein / transcript_product=hypothetical protein / location=Cvel_scaffold1350:1107-8102(+) / protein_length=1938 / sequence_SO=supercontig / SO=protein_coding / is_pseudo=false